MSDDSKSGPASASDRELPGVLVGTRGSFAILEVIGKGAYGTVYKGIWREVGRHVAIKRVVRSRVSPDEERAMQAEIDLFKHLKHHHIVNYIEAVDDPNSDSLDIVMEYVEGGSLFSIVQKIRKSQKGLTTENAEHIFSEKVVASFIKQVLDGLTYLHMEGVVHRDIKGANILVTKESHVKLADFGVASARRGESSSTASPLDVAGTPYWMAPEIISLEGCSTASDIWSVGCTVIELLTGFPPYHKLSDVTALFRIVADECPPLPDRISGGCQDFLRLCFNKDVNLRPTAHELLRHPWVVAGRFGDEEETSRDGESPDEDEFAGLKITNDTDGTAGLGPDEPENDQVGALLNKYEEDDDDDDFGDVDFGDPADGDLGTDLANTDAGIPAGDSVSQGAAGSFFSANDLSSTASVEKDPFRDIQADPEAERERENLRRHRDIWQRVKTQTAALGTDEHIAACSNLVSIFDEYPEQRYSLIYDPGLLPILEILEYGVSEGANDHTSIEAMLRVSLSLLDCDDDKHRDSNANGNGGLSRENGVLDRSEEPEREELGYPRVSDIRHDLCLAGFIPAVLPYCASRFSLNCRHLAARFIEELLVQESTLHMFVACRGFTIFTELLEPDIETSGDLPTLALKGVDQMLSMEKQRLKRDFCRRFALHGLFDRIVEGMDLSAARLNEFARCEQLAQVKARAAEYAAHMVKLAELLQTFAARADPAVKARMTRASVLNPIVQHVVCRAVPSEAIGRILCCLRDLSRDPHTHDALQEACAIEVLVQYLSSCTTQDDAKTRHYIVSCLHNLLMVSPARQEAATRAGIVPYLQIFIRSHDIHLRSLCIDIYSGLACSGPGARVELGKHGGVDFYVELLRMLSVPGTVRKWQARVLQSLYEWLDDTSQSKTVEERLVHANNCENACAALAQMRVADVEAVLEPYWRMISSSTKVNRALGASEELIRAMVKWLEHMYRPDSDAGEPRGRLLLLRILRAHSVAWSMGAVPVGLMAELRLLLADQILIDEKATMVREQASRLLVDLDRATSL